MEVGDLEGVQSVDVSVDTKFVEIIFSSPATEEKIKKLLTEINYTPNE
jgi:copper chaperone CopZ